MKTLIALFLSLLLPLAALAGNGSGNVSSVYNTGVVGTNAQPVATVPFFQDSDATYPTFTLLAGSSSVSTTNNYYPFYRDGTAYATPSNKKTYCKSLVGGGSTSYLNFQLVTSTASITFNQSAALTSGKYWCGADQRFCLVLQNSAANAHMPTPGNFVFGDGSTVTYVGFQSNSSAQSYQMELNGCYEK